MWLKLHAALLVPMQCCNVAREALDKGGISEWKHTGIGTFAMLNSSATPSSTWCEGGHRKCDSSETLSIANTTAEKSWTTEKPHTMCTNYKVQDPASSNRPGNAAAPSFASYLGVHFTGR
jgi:hypothetical protein